MMLLVEVPDAVIAAAVKAIMPFAASEPKLLALMPLPDEIQEKKDFEEKAQMIAAAVPPTGNRPMRKEALQAVLFGHDTFMGQGGEADPALRNAVAALSKALRPFSMFASPLDLLCSRDKEYFADGACKGMYRGTRYRPTKLGKRVREILKEKAVL